MPIGTLHNFWQEKNKVKIEDRWFDLSQNINAQFVEPLIGQMVNFTLTVGNEKLISYISKANAGEMPQMPAQTYSGGGYKKPFVPFKKNSSSNFNPEYDIQKQKNIHAQWAVNAAIEWIKTHNVSCAKDEIIKPTQIKINELAIILSAMARELATEKVI